MERKKLAMGTALVIGANRGIGLELAKQLKDRGHRVLATCRTRSAELDQLDVEVHPDVDVTSDEAVTALAERLAGTPVDILICSSGILLRESLDDLALEDIRRQFEVNALGPLRVVAALRSSLDRGSKVALITSRMGSIGDNTSGNSYGYRMSKAALNMAGVSLSRDLDKDGIAVAILHPGFVRTEMTGHRGNVEPHEAAAQLLDRIDELTLQTSGTFYHANGEHLPW
jgi:NAD(P)-dependent dehydrogenase (short-subunit alcohol dehydrogenase family)